jgi:hypothetical protein
LRDGYILQLGNRITWSKVIVFGACCGCDHGDLFITIEKYVEIFKEVKFPGWE